MRCFFLFFFFSFFPFFAGGFPFKSSRWPRWHPLEPEPPQPEEQRTDGTDLVRDMAREKTLHEKNAQRSVRSWLPNRAAGSSSWVPTDHRIADSAVWLGGSHLFYMLGWFSFQPPFRLRRLSGCHFGVRKMTNPRGLNIRAPLTDICTCSHREPGR